MSLLHSHNLGPRKCGGCGSGRQRCLPGCCKAHDLREQPPTQPAHDMPNIDSTHYQMEIRIVLLRLEVFITFRSMRQGKRGGRGGGGGGAGVACSNRRGLCFSLAKEQIPKALTVLRVRSFKEQLLPVGGVGGSVAFVGDTIQLKAASMWVAVGRLSMQNSDSPCWTPIVLTHQAPRPPVG